MSGWRIGENGWEPDPSEQFSMAEVEFALFLDSLDPLTLRPPYVLTPEEREIARRLHYQQLLSRTRGQRNTSSRS